MKQILILVFVLILLHACKLASDAQKYKAKQHEQCLWVLNTYQPYWIKDSIGDNGFRLLAIEMLKNRQCNFIGEKWRTIAPYFGKPNKVYVTDSTIEIIYNLNSIKGTDFGRKYLGIDIAKSDSSLISFGTWMKDG